MNKIPKPILFLAAIVFVAVAWDRALRYYVKTTNPTIINSIEEEMKSDPSIANKIGRIRNVEESFEIYSFSPDSIWYKITFEGDQKDLHLEGRATRLNENSNWTIIHTDTIIKHN